MEILFVLGFIALITVLLIVGKIVETKNIRKRIFILLNLLLSGYEMFFLLAVFGCFPTMMVHFGGGLGDLFFTFILIALVILHLVVLCIMSYKVSHSNLFWVPFAISVFILLILHGIADGGGKHNDYSAFGNSRGLYYNYPKISEEHAIRRKQVTDSLEALKPKFENEFEEHLYWAEKGQALSQGFVGACYCNGINGVGQDYKLGFEWISKAANNENPDHLSWENLAMLYFYGTGVEQNYEEAVWWSRMVVECKNLRYENPKRAQYIFGYCLLWGKGVEQDRDEGIKWLKKSAQNGNKDAQEELIGLGV